MIQKLLQKIPSTILCGVLLFTTQINAQNSLDFDGTNDYIDCGNHSSIDITGSSLSVEAWIYPTAFQANIWQGTVLSKVDLGMNGYMLRVGNGGQVNFNIGTGNWNELNSPVGAVTLNNWHHIAGTFDGSIMKLYVDGIIIDSLVATSSIGSATLPLYIGEDPQWGGRYFPGRIDEVRIWDDTRTTNEIKAYMANEFCDSTGLVAWYKLDQGIAAGMNTSDTVAYDILGNNDGTLNNFALNSTNSNWVNGASIQSLSSRDVQFACGSFAWIDGNNYTTSNNTATHVIIGGATNGCDSIVNLDLTIVPNVNSTDVQIACGPYTWIDGNTYMTSNNTAKDTIVRGSVNGCDSIITLDLTIVPNLTGTDVQSAIGSYTWIDGVTYTTSNNTATHTIVGAGANGCDSLITLDLTILVTNGQNSLHFDGIDDFVDCGTDPSLDITGTSISLEAWIYPTSFKGLFWQGNVINKAETGENGYMLRVGGAGEVNFNLGTGVWNEITSPPGAVTLNTWHHIAGTYDGSTMILYVDGIQITSAPLTANIGSTTTSLFLGEDPQWRGRYYPGRIENVRVWNDARTAFEIDNFRFGDICDSNNLVAWYQFNQGTPTIGNLTVDTLNDVTGVNNGTLQNFALTGNSSNWLNGVNISNNIMIDTQSDCKSYTWIDGITYFANDSNARFILPAAATNGCDSIIQLALTITPINNGVTANGTMLTANEAGATYQWLNCSTGGTYTVISGATNQSYMGILNSSYAVEITVNGCSDTSACQTILAVGLNESTINPDLFTVYPNPTKEFLNIQLGSNLETNEIVRVYSVKGELVHKSVLSKNHTTLDLTNLESGLYLVRYLDKNKKVLINK